MCTYNLQYLIYYFSIPGPKSVGIGHPDVDKKLNCFVHHVIRDLIGSMDVLSPSFHSHTIIVVISSDVLQTQGSSFFRLILKNTGQDDFFGPSIIFVIPS